MVNFDANTPQLKAVKKWFDGYFSLDMKSVESVLSKDFKVRAFPKTADLHEDTKETHVQRFRGVFASTAKTDTIYHEVIEAPGKVVVHFTTVFTTTSGAALDYDAVMILSLIKEDGEVKILESKTFVDPQQRSAFFAGAARTS